MNYQFRQPSYGNESRFGLPDPRNPPSLYGPPHGQGPSAPSYCQMQDYLNGAAQRGVSPMMPRTGAGPTPAYQERNPWPPEYASQGTLESRGLSGPSGPPNPFADQGRAFGLGPPNPYSWQRDPTPPSAAIARHERSVAEHPPDRGASNSSGWEVLNEELVWQPWQPGVKFYGVPGEQLEFAVGSQVYFVVFDSAVAGTQVNLRTGNRRPLRRRIDSADQRPLTPPPLRSAPCQFPEPQHLLPPSLRHPWNAPDAAPHGSGRGAEAVRQPFEDFQRDASMLRQPEQMPHLAPNDTRLPEPQRFFQDHAAAVPQAAASPEVTSRRTDQPSPPQSEAAAAPAPEVIVLGDGEAFAPAVSAEAEAAAAIEPVVDRATETFTLLEDLRLQVEQIERKMPVILESLEEEAVTAGQARDNLAQLEGRLHKLQDKGIDCVSLEGLSTETAEQARAIRRDLTMSTERLQSKFESIFALLRDKYGK